MKIQVQLIDLLNNEIVYHGLAQTEDIKNNGLCIYMKNKKMSYIWKCYEKGLAIESISDYKVSLTLRENNVTKGHIETEYGIIYLQCKTSLYKMNEKCIEVKYDLIQGNETQPFHFVLNLNKEEIYAIH